MTGTSRTVPAAESAAPAVPTAPAADDGVGPPRPARWLLRRPDADAEARIFCFPYSGVGASMFSRWPRRIGRAETCPIQLPARENRIRERHFGTFGRLAENLIEPLLPHLDRPFVFFGHCAGVLPAFETARQLAARGLPTPDRLVVSAQVPPHECPHDRFLGLSDEELTDELSQQVIARGGTPHPLLMKLTLDVLHQDLDATALYTTDGPTPLPSGITVLRWSDDPEVPPGRLDGWSAYSDDVEFAVLGGGHYEFLSAPADLMSLLERVTAPAKGGSDHV
ncbi:Surfactin synthase thioesterase subunit [Streptomyces pini]|uniref:Surfactin synthase thioesterase subunit n=1 Tax=Streptomyces pini TaxID=1520580 RepID=A0A1I4GS02_9ACTN|nr:Surfactin synthase thioesterase subunit [Streptomyces pini]